MVDFAEIKHSQQTICAQYATQYSEPPLDTNVGLARSTKTQLPLNGLRHSPTETTSGWFIWCGESFSEAPDWFVPVCIAHLYEEMPEIAAFLALPPGYRFLVVGEYVDVWFDASLLNM